MTSNNPSPEEQMRDRIVFFAVATLAALTLSPIIAAMAAYVGSLAGMSAATLLVVFGSTAAGAFAALMGLAGLAANLFLKPRR
ncbi:hypothetical protein [Actinoplanes regularis]|uniref:hypothetical protein n=1 Tax=Actinoplanes regularis TaxID=52697 RepID=UPI0024A26AC4|nr:hypothetical protein [Actinoplanes regularis]GLW30996.1 hypothetical protein Areg01_39360 [Actinoplanes regularis]